VFFLGKCLIPLLGPSFFPLGDALRRLCLLLNAVLILLNAGRLSSQELPSTITPSGPVKMGVNYVNDSVYVSPPPTNVTSDTTTRIISSSSSEIACHLLRSSTELTYLIQGESVCRIPGYDLRFQTFTLNSTHLWCAPLSHHLF